MPKYQNKKTKLQELTEVWYKNLKDSGFQDIEKNEDKLKRYSRTFTDNYSPESWKEKELYYQMASSFLNDYKFESQIQKLVWEYHANGIVVRDISILLKKAKITSIYTSRNEVSKIVLKLRKDMFTMYSVTKADFDV